VQRRRLPRVQAPAGITQLQDSPDGPGHVATRGLADVWLEVKRSDRPLTKPASSDWQRTVDAFVVAGDTRLVPYSE
jgi:hypothetical protein